MEPIALQPIPATNRTVIIDILRGWAIIGVVIGNYDYFAELEKKFSTHQYYFYYLPIFYYLCSDGQVMDHA